MLPGHCSAKPDLDGVTQTLQRGKPTKDQTRENRRKNGDQGRGEEAPCVDTTQKLKHYRSKENSPNQSYPQDFKH